MIDIYLIDVTQGITLIVSWLHGRERGTLHGNRHEYFSVAQSRFTEKSWVYIRVNPFALNRANPCRLLFRHPWLQSFP